MNNLPSLLQNKYVVIIGSVVIFLLLGLVILFSSSNLNTQDNTNNTEQNGQPDQAGNIGGARQSDSNQSSSNTANPTGTATQPKKTASEDDEYPIPAYQNNYVINFEHSAYAKYAYQVFPGPISAETKKQLGSFTISTLKYPDGHTAVTLHFNQQGYEDVQVNANPGEKIYYVRLPDYEDPGDVGLIRVGTDGNISTQ